MPKKVNTVVPKTKKKKEVFICPNEACGSKHTVRHGYNVTKHGKFARRKCQICGTTFYEDSKEVKSSNVEVKK